jgi:hypothetical protein
MTEILFEDEELERFVMEGDSQIAVPIQVMQKKSGECALTVYSRFSKEAKEFCRLYGDDPLSDAAKDYIVKTFSRPMEDAGYEYEADFDQTVLNYTTDGAALNEIVCGAEVVIVETNEKLSEIYIGTTRDFELDDDDPCDALAAVLCDGMALSLAGVNDYSDDGSLEINVETVPSERSRGYGAAAVSALCRHLMSLGERVSYRCRESNIPSRRVAEKAGLVYTGKTYSFVCYKN